jgi:leucyl aminopeptidase
MSNTFVIIPLPDINEELDLSIYQQNYPSKFWTTFSNGKLGDWTVEFFYPDLVSEILVAVTRIKTEVINHSQNTFFKIGNNKKLQFYSNLMIDLRLVERFWNSNQLNVLNQRIGSGLKMGITPMNLFKKAPIESPIFNQISYIAINKDSSAGFEKGWELGNTINKIRQLVNLPSNKKSPIEMADWFRDSSKEHNYQLTILEKEQLEEEGFMALLAVNRGSTVPAKCLIAEYSPKGAKDQIPTIALVGKGVTFDTGGLSIKGHQNMHYMKSDMGGAAAVMGAVEMVAKIGLDVRIIGIVPTTDNSVDALSIKPGDVIGSYSGKTIEVIDTDAEGRLILADALSYVIQNYNPDYVIDLATLTGSVVRALGTEAAGFMTQNEQLANTLNKASQLSGEKIWRLPLDDEYNKYLQSDIADLRNLGTKPMAGAITAAKFLEAFTHKHPCWAHLDIAGVAFGSMPGSKGYAATGFGISLLLEMIQLLKNEIK